MNWVGDQIVVVATGSQQAFFEQLLNKLARIASLTREWSGG